jgi:hypothetical protein
MSLLLWLVAAVAVAVAAVEVDLKVAAAAVAAEVAAVAAVAEVKRSNIGLPVKQTPWRIKQIKQNKRLS